MFLFIHLLFVSVQPKSTFPTIKMIALVLRRLFMTTSMKCAPHNPTVNNTDLSNPNHVLLSQAKYNIRHKPLLGFK